MRKPECNQDKKPPTKTPQNVSCVIDSHPQPTKIALSPDEVFGK